MKKMKKGYVVCLITGLALGSCFTTLGGQWISAYRNDEVKITLNDVSQTFRDETTGEVMYPLTYNDRTYLPLRNVANLSGLNVDYDGATKTAKLTTRDYTPVINNNVSNSSNTTQNSVNTNGINSNDIIITGEKLTTNHKFIDNYNLSVANIKEQTKTNIDNMVNKTVSNYAALYNLNAAKNSSLFNSTVHENAYDGSIESIDADIRGFNELLKNSNISLKVICKNTKIMGYYANNKGDIAVHVTFDQYLKNTVDNGEKFVANNSLLLLRDRENFKIFSTFQLSGVQSSNLTINNNDKQVTSSLLSQTSTQSTLTASSYLKMAQDMYNKVNFNMTETDVIKAIGEPTNKVTQSGGDIKLEYKTKKGSYDVRLIEIYISSSTGKVRSAQIVLSSSSSYGVSLSKEMNSQIEDLNVLVTKLNKDMTYEEVTSILGNSNFEYSKSNSAFGTEYKYYKWVDKNDSYCTPVFYDGKLSFVPNVYNKF